MTLYYVVLFAEEDFAGIRRYKDEDQASAFAEGFSEGGSKYGAGSCVAYVYPSEEEEMRNFQQADAIEEAMKAIAKDKDKDNGRDSDH